VLATVTGSSPVDAPEIEVEEIAEVEEAAPEGE
jgi:hypothetical protein